MTRVVWFTSRTANLLATPFGVLLALIMSSCGGSTAAPSTSAIAPSSPVAQASNPSSAVASAKPAGSAKPAASAATSAASTAPGTIKVSWGQPAAGFGPVWLAQDQGIFKKYGLTTDVVHLAPPADTQAVISGDVQFVIGGSAAIGAMANGADIPFIAVTVPYFVQSLFSQPSITKITDLAGKKVGVTTKGGPADLALQTLLKRNSVDASTVSTAYLRDDATIFASLQSSQIQAAIITSPNTLRAKQAGLRDLQDMFPLKIPTLTQGIDVRRDWASQNQNAVENFLKAYVESIQVFKTNQGVAKSTISKWTQLTDQAMLDESYQLASSELAAYPVVQDASVQNVIDLATDAQVKSHPPSYYYDNSYLEPLKGFAQSLYPNGLPS